jgi:hypothetical protein
MQLEIEYVALTEVEGWPRNAKTHDEDLIRDSIMRFGFNDPLAVNATTGKLLEGHGRLKCLRDMKLTGQDPPLRVEARDGEWYVPVVQGVGFESDLEAEAYMLAHNRSTEKGGWYDATLATILRDVVDTDLGLKGIGFDETFMRQLLENQPSDFDDIDPDKMGCDYQCPKCSYEWSGKPK